VGNATGTTGDKSTLYVYSWTNYTDPELLRDFQSKTGIQVVVDNYDSNETMLAKMQAGGGSQYSVIFPSDYMVTQMVELGMLTELDQSRLRGLATLKPQWQNPSYDPNNAHSVPATWGTTGFVFDPTRLPGEMRGWDYLFDNQAQLTRQITLINDVREVMGSVLRFLGYSFNSENASELEAAYKKLVELKPAIANFLTNGWEDQIASGDLSVSMAYSTDALSLMAEAPNLKYIVPESGSSLWTDTIVIPKTAPHPDAAYEWINYFLNPENNANLVSRLKFATPNQAAFDLLPSELKEDPNLFPPEEVLAKCERIAPVSEKITEAFDSYWTQLTSA
jgi:spermidine/putrescine transport system substrate-binding protein